MRRAARALGDVDGLVAGVDDEVDVRRGQLATDEANVLLVRGELKIRSGGLMEGCGQL